MAAQSVTNKFSSVYNAVSMAHEAYIYGYGCVGSVGRCAGSVGSWIWRRSRVGPYAKKAVTFPINVSCSCAAWSVDKFRAAGSLANRYIRGQDRPVHGYFQTHSPTYDSLQVEKAQRCFDLSVSCSRISDSPILIADSNKTVLRHFRHYLEMLRESWTFSEVIKIQEIDHAIIEVDRLLDVLERLDIEMDRATTVEDIQNFIGAINDKLLICFFVASGLENFGENYGGVAIGTGLRYVSESGILPFYLNPCEIASSVGSTVGAPLGRAVGFSTLVVSNYFLLKSLLKSSSREKILMVNSLALSSILMMELYGLNPVSNGLKDLFSSQLSDLTFYSIGLIGNYLGMLVCNTGETLPDYVRKMIPSTIVYKAAEYLLDSGLGLNPFSSFIISFYLSHVAYNFDGYKSLFLGTLVGESLTFDNGMTCIERKLSQKCSDQMISETVSSFLKSIIQSGLESIEEASEVCGQEKMLDMLLQQLHPSLSETPGARRLPLRCLPASCRLENRHLLLHHLSKLSSLCAVSSVSQKLLDVIQREGAAQFSPLLQSLKESKDRWIEIERHGPHAEAAFVVSQLNEYFHLIDNPEISSLIRQYKIELMKVIGQSRLDHADFDRLLSPSQNRQISQLRNELIQKIVKAVFGQEEINPIYSSMILAVLDSHISPELFIQPIDLVNKELKKLLLLPCFNKEQSLCATVTTDLLIKGFMIFSLLNLSLRADHCRDQVQPLDPEQLKMLTRNLIHLVFDVISPNKGILNSVIERIARYETH